MSSKTTSSESISAVVPQIAPMQVPTSAPTYTKEELARAGADLAGRSPEIREAVIALLKNQFGGATIANLPPDRYGEFAIAIRSLGAAI